VPVPEPPPPRQPAREKAAITIEMFNLRNMIVLLRPLA
jgi:hypothetical protein